MNAFRISAAIALLSIAACAILLTLHLVKLVDAWSTVPSQLSQLQTAVQELPQHIIPQVLPPVLAEVDKQANGIRRDTLAQITEIRDTANSRIGDALSRYDATLHLVDARSAAIADTAAGIRQDLQPTLKASATLLKDGQDSWDDSYNDVRGLLQSRVATTQAAQTLQTINAATPKLTNDVSGIAADFHDATHNLDMKFFHPPPRTEKQRMQDFFKVFLPSAIIAILRSGAY